MDTPETQATLR